MNFDYAIHSDFLIYWTGKDIDAAHDGNWYQSDKSNTNGNTQINDLYVTRLFNILKYGLWMSEEQSFELFKVIIPPTPITCFTELKLSQARKHARQYGRLGIGVKRPFVLNRFGRPMVYYGFHQDLNSDKFLETYTIEIQDKRLINFFKPMNSTATLNYDFYAESEWRILFFKELLLHEAIIDPRDSKNVEAYCYFNKLTLPEQNKLKYLIPLDGWLAMIIYPSLAIKNISQQNMSVGIRAEIDRLRNLNSVERRNLPIELDLDACRNF